MRAAAHRLDDRERRQVVERRLAAPGRSGGADILPHVETGAENRRIADPPGNLPRQAARGRHAADFTARTDGVAVDRAPEMVRVDQPLARHLEADRIAGVDTRRRALGPGVRARIHPAAPFDPEAARLRRQQILDERSRARRELLRARPDQQMMWRVAHHATARPAPPSRRLRARPRRRRAAAGRPCSRHRAAPRRRRWAGCRGRRSFRQDRARRS